MTTFAESCNDREMQRPWNDKSEAAQSLQNVHEILRHFMAVVVSSAFRKSLNDSCKWREWFAQIGQLRLGPERTNNQACTRTFAWICRPQLPHHQCKNRTHSTTFCNTRGHTLNKANRTHLHKGWPNHDHDHFSVHLAGPLFSFLGYPRMTKQMPLLHSGTQRNHKEFWSDVSSNAVLVWHQMQSFFG